jgi:hypothetical protein
MLLGSIRGCELVVFLGLVLGTHRRAISARDIIRLAGVYTVRRIVAQINATNAPAEPRNHNFLTFHTVQQVNL